jgi:hemerythrin superfamily protein
MAHIPEQIGAKVMGAAKLGKAALEGLSGVFLKLAQEHGEVSALLMRVRATQDPQIRAELFPQIRAELLSHERGELTVVYPALRRHDETRMLADEHDMQAGQLEKMLNELSARAYNAPDWPTLFDALVDLVQRHVAKEEQEYFPRADKVMSSDETDTLRREYEDVKASTRAALA